MMTVKEFLTRVLAIAIAVLLIFIILLFETIPAILKTEHLVYFATVILLLFVLLILTLMCYILLTGKHRNTPNGRQSMSGQQRINTENNGVNGINSNLHALRSHSRRNTNVEMNLAGNVPQNNQFRETLEVALRNINSEPPSYEQVINDKQSVEEQPPPDYTEAVKNLNSR